MPRSRIYTARSLRTVLLIKAEMYRLSFEQIETVSTAFPARSEERVGVNRFRNRRNRSFRSVISPSTHMEKRLFLSTRRYPKNPREAGTYFPFGFPA